MATLSELFVTHIFVLLCICWRWVQVFQYGTGVMRFSRAQGECIFGLGDLPQATFQTNVRPSSILNSITLF